jgi:hypothetical protein
MLRQCLHLLLAFSIFLGACAPVQKTQSAAAHHIPVRWRYFIASPADQTGERVVLRLNVDGRNALEEAATLDGHEVKSDLTLVEGVHFIEAQVVGRVSVRFALKSAPRTQVILWLARQEEAPSPAIPGALVLKYEVNDESPMFQRPPGVSENIDMLRRTVPLHITFLREDLKRAMHSDEQEADVPLRIRVDGRPLFDGIARAGNDFGPGFLCRVKPGTHTVELEVPGEVKKTTVVDIGVETWVQAHFWRSEDQPTFHVVVSNGPVPVF